MEGKLIPRYMVEKSVTLWMIWDNADQKFLKEWYDSKDEAIKKCNELNAN